MADFSNHPWKFWLNKLKDKFNDVLPLTETLAKQLGYTDKTKQTQSNYVNTQNRLKSDYDCYSIQSLLPYDSYDPDSQIYINQRSLGWGLQLTPSTGANDSFIEILASILTDVLPAGGDVQFLLWASPKIGPAIDAVEQCCGSRGGEFLKLAKKQSEYLKQGAHQSLSRHSDFILRDHQLFIFFSLPKSHRSANLDMLLQYRDEVASSLRSMSVSSEVVTVHQFLSYLHDIISPNKSIYPAQTSWNQYDSLSQQITNTEQLITIAPNKINFIHNQITDTAPVTDNPSQLDQHHSKSTWEACCFSVKHYPKSMSQWQMGESIGQLFNSALQIPCPYLVSLHVHLLDAEKSRAKVQAKILGKDSKAHSSLTKWLPSLNREYQDWTFIRDRLEEGDQLVSTFFQVVLFSESHTMRRAERKLRDLYQSNGWKLQLESYLQLQSFLSALPMMMSEGMFQDLKHFGRLKTMTAFNAVNIAPLQGEWKGYQKPLLCLPGRRGQIAWWDPFGNTEGNYNVAIAAKSRSGKSVFVQTYIGAMVGSGGRCWVIDIGHSYEKTCRLLNGTFVEFSMNQPICINPFTHIKNFSEALPMLIPLLGGMARPKTTTSEEEDAYLEKAIVAAWQTASNQATITTVKEKLLAMQQPIADNIAHLLVSYCKNGMYSAFFEGQASQDMQNPFIVFELLGLKNKKELQRIVLLVLMAQVHHTMYLTGRSQTKSCIIDEAWDLFGEDSGGAAKFIETGYRTSARHNGNFISITQSINDYYKSASSIAAFENSDLKVILAQTPESIEQIKKSGRFHIDEFLERLLKSVRKVEGAYSECVIRSPEGYSAHRIVLNPFTRILFSSKGSEYDAVKKLEAQGLSLYEAVDRVAKELA